MVTVSKEREVLPTPGARFGARPVPARVSVNG